MTISPTALKTALIQIPNLRAAKCDGDLTSLVAALTDDAARDVWHSLRRIGWESPADEQQQGNDTVLKQWESPDTIDGRCEGDALHDNLLWWLTSDDIYIGPRDERRRATSAERCDDALSRLKVIEKNATFSPESRCHCLSHIRCWSIGQSYQSGPLGHPPGDVWHDSGKEPWDGAAYNEYFQLRFDEYTIAGAINKAADLFERSERLRFTPAIDNWLVGKEGSVNWFVIEAKKQLDRNLRHLRDAWEDEIKASGELLEDWKIFKNGDFQPVRTPRELRDWLNHWHKRASSCIAGTETKINSLIDDKTSQEMLSEQLAEAVQEPGPPKRIWDKAAGFLQQRTGLFGGLVLDGIHNELRNARLFLRHCDLPIPVEFSDEPIDLRAAEKQLEKLIDGPLADAAKESSDIAFDGRQQGRSWLEHFEMILLQFGRLFETYQSEDPEDFEFCGYMHWCEPSKNHSREHQEQLALDLGAFVRSLRSKVGPETLSAIEFDSLNELRQLLRLDWTHANGIRLLQLSIALQENLTEIECLVATTNVVTDEGTTEPSTAVESPLRKTAGESSGKEEPSEPQISSKCAAFSRACNQLADKIESSPERLIELLKSHEDEIRKRAAQSGYLEPCPKPFGLVGEMITPAPPYRFEAGSDIPLLSTPPDLLRFSNVVWRDDPAADAPQIARHLRMWAQCPYDILQQKIDAAKPLRRTTLREDSREGRLLIEYLDRRIRGIDSNNGMTLAELEELIGWDESDSALSRNPWRQHQCDLLRNVLNATADDAGIEPRDLDSVKDLVFRCSRKLKNQDGALNAPTFAQNPSDNASALEVALEIINSQIWGPLPPQYPSPRIGAPRDTCANHAGVLQMAATEVARLLGEPATELVELAAAFEKKIVSDRWVCVPFELKGKSEVLLSRAIQQLSRGSAASNKMPVRGSRDTPENGVEPELVGPFSLLEFAMALTDERSSQEDRVVEAKQIRSSFRRLWEPGRKKIDKPTVIDTKKYGEECFAFEDLCRVADAAEQRYERQKVLAYLESPGVSPQN